MTKIIGLTGGIGSGKSTVANYIKSKGIPVYVADLEAKKLMELPETINEIVSVFGVLILNENGHINRSALASIVFNNKEKLEALNKIVHPKVKLHFEKWLDENKKSDFVFKEVAILFETKGNLECDKVVLVTAPLEVRLERTIKRDATNKESVLARMKNQMPEEDKIKLADYVIHNLNLKDTFLEVDDLLKKLKDCNKSINC